MSTSVQWATHSETSARGGWMLGKASSHRVSKPRNCKIAYAKKSSHSPLHRGWLLTKDSLRSTSSTSEENPSTFLGKASEAVLLDYQRLSTRQVDDLAENGVDWIGCFPSGSELEVLNFSLLGVDTLNAVWRQDTLSVDKLVHLTQQAKHYPLRFADSVCWSYTCCLQVAGLGRVRLVVGRQYDSNGGEYAAFVTNRLDWSPRKVISQCLQLSPLPNLLDRGLLHHLSRHRSAGLASSF